MRIYIDESGTHAHEWLVIGILMVPDHGPLHSALCAAKDDLEYFNKSKKYSSKYKETHLTKFRSDRDLAVAKEWIDIFLRHNCYYRSMVIDWSIWDGKYFGDAFESVELKKRRAYKKWTEMLISPEIRTSEGDPKFYHAKLYLDRLLAVRGYDVLDHLRNKFTENYQGEAPFIDDFQHTDSWRDANQCLQLCDLLTGVIYQQLVPAKRGGEKVKARDYAVAKFSSLGVENFSPGFWRQYAPRTLNKHFPKFSVRYWQPNSEGRKKRRR